MPPVLVYVLEAFTVGENEPYSGNPAAVCILQCDDEIPDEIKGKIANTFNLGATAFVSLAWSQRQRGDSISIESPTEEFPPTEITRCIRWYTPSKEEVPLCGHGTMAACKAILDLYSHEKFPNQRGIESIRFETKERGTFTAFIEPESEVISLNFPTIYTTRLELHAEASRRWLPEVASLVLGPSFPNPMEEIQDVQLCSQNQRLILRLRRKTDGEEPEETIKRVQPDFGRILNAKAGDMKLHGVVVTIQGDPEVDSRRPQFYSRNFIPKLGVHEDYATGSIHSILVPYWTKELGREGRELFARQASSRGGDLHCELIEEGAMVRISGSVRAVSKGTLVL